MFDRSVQFAAIIALLLIVSEASAQSVLDRVLAAEPLEPAPQSRPARQGHVAPPEDRLPLSSVHPVGERARLGQDRRLRKGVLDFGGHEARPSLDALLPWLSARALGDVVPIPEIAAVSPAAANKAPPAVAIVGSVAAILPDLGRHPNGWSTHVSGHAERVHREIDAQASKWTNPRFDEAEIRTIIVDIEKTVSTNVFRVNGR